MPCIAGRVESERRFLRSRRTNSPPPRRNTGLFFARMVSVESLTGDEPWLNKLPHESLTWDEIPIERGEAIRILALRGMSYARYLRTNHWHSVRTRAMRKTSWQCVACNSNASEAHHVEYKRKGFERIEDVVATCRSCHMAWHQTWNLQVRESLK